MALVTLDQPQSAASEAYRGLRTNLAFARAVEPDNAALAARVSAAESTRKRGEPTELRFSGLDPAHVRVVWTESPQTEALIAWSTAEAGSEHRVYFDREPHNGRLDEYAESRPTTRDGVFTRTTRTDADGSNRSPKVTSRKLPITGPARVPGPPTTVAAIGRIE